jgi:hypothetical protein
VSSPNGLGGYPVHINTIFTGTYNPNMVGFKGTTGCTGSGRRLLTDVPDLVIDTPLVASGGLPVAGFGDDAFKFDTGFGCSGFVKVSDPGLTGACTGITIVGNINTGNIYKPCGGTNPGEFPCNHQDCVQELGGDNVWMHDVRSGDFKNEIIGCIGDGGALYINAAAPSGGASCVPQPSGTNCMNPGWCVKCQFDRFVQISCIHGVHTQMLSQGTPGATGASVSAQNSTGYIHNGIWRANGCPNFTWPGPIDASLNNYAAGFAAMASDAPGWDIPGSGVFANVRATATRLRAAASPPALDSTLRTTTADGTSEDSRGRDPGASRFGGRHLPGRLHHRDDGAGAGEDDRPDRAQLGLVVVEVRERRRGQHVAAPLRLDGCARPLLLGAVLLLRGRAPHLGGDSWRSSVRARRRSARSGSRRRGSSSCSTRRRRSGPTRRSRSRRAPGTWSSLKIKVPTGGANNSTLEGALLDVRHRVGDDVRDVTAQSIGSVAPDNVLHGLGDLAGRRDEPLPRRRRAERRHRHEAERLPGPGALS